MTISSWFFFCVFAVLIDKVCLQLTGVVGGSVVLPCSTEHDHELQDTEVFWRHNNSKIVHDIIKGSQTETQDSLYKNRIESFPDEYLRGNFSIKLSGLTHAHAGKYICFITPSDEQKTVQLIINEPTAEKGNKTNDQENPNQEETVLNVVTSSHFQRVIIVVSVLLLLLLLLIMLIVCLIRFYL